MENINRGFDRKYGSILESCDKGKKKVEECDKVQECDKKPSTKKELQESPIYGLKNEYDSKGFGGKAQVETDNKGNETLYSYDTPVVKISGDKVTLLPKWDSSATTLRHVKEFLKQHDFKAESKAQIAKDYITESCDRRRRKSIRELLEEISPEDQHDSDLLRSVILKSRGRSNAALTKDEKDVLNKYDLTRYDGDIYRKDKVGNYSYKLDRDVDVLGGGGDFIDPETSDRTARRLSRGRTYPRGIDKVNLADRARKLSSRDYEKKVGSSYVSRSTDGNYDFRGAEKKYMQKPYNDVKGAIYDRKDSSRELSDAKAKYDAAVARAKDDYDFATKYYNSRIQRADDTIDKNLKRGKYAPATESFRRRRIKEGRGVEIDDTFDEINAFLQGGEFEKTTRPGMKGRSRIKGIVDYRQVGVTRDGDIKVRVEDEDRAEEVEEAILDKFGDVVEIKRKKDKYDNKLPINIIIKIVGGEVIDDIDKKFKKKNESIGSDVAEYQKWVDYDMKRYKKISEKTMSKIKKAGLSVVKDQYGDYEVIAKEPVKESIAKKTKNRALIREAVRKTQEKKNHVNESFGTKVAKWYDDRYEYFMQRERDNFGKYYFTIGKDSDWRKDFDYYMKDFNAILDKYDPSGSEDIDKVVDSMSREDKEKLAAKYHLYLNEEKGRVVAKRTQKK